MGYQWKCLTSDISWMSRDPILTEFGRRLRQARQRAGMNQTELGAAAGEISQPVISEYESGDRNPTLLTIHRLAGAVGVIPSELVDDLEEE